MLWRGLGQGVRVITAMAACVVAALTGLLAGDLIRAMSPGAEPVQQIAAWILPVLLTYTVLRLFLEDEAALDFRPYLVLPFARRRLWLLAVLQTHLSWWNLFPISVALAFWSAEVVVGYPTAGSILFLVAVILTLAWTAFLVSLVREWIRRTPIWASAAAFGLGGLVIVAPIVGGPSLAQLSESVFESALQGQIWPVWTLGLITAVFGAGHGAMLWRQMRIDRSASARQRSPAMRSQFGASGLLLKLLHVEGHMMMRTRATRLNVGLLVLGAGIAALLGAFGTSLFLPIEDSARLSAVSTSDVGRLIGLANFAFQFILLHTSRSFAWEGQRLEGLLARGVTCQRLAESKVIVAQVATFVLATPPLLIGVLAGSDTFVLSFAAFVLYELGVGAPICVWVAAYNRVPVDLNRKMGLVGPASSAAWLVAAPVIFAPVAFIVFVLLPTALGILAGAGIASLVCTPFWTKRLGAVVRRRRHTLLRDFRT